MAIGRTFSESFAKAMRSRELDAPPRAAGRRPTSCSSGSRRRRATASTCSRGLPARRSSSSRSSWSRTNRDRPLVPAASCGRSAERGRRHRGARARTYPGRSTPAPPSSRPRRPTTTRPTSAGPSADAAATAPSADGEVRRGDRASVVILGSGPNRIGQGIEFDYCCVHAAMTVRESGRDAVMVNCNPETVSTDYDTSDRLYFEPLTAEDVLEVIEVEQPEGVIVQFGGQTPLRLAQPPAGRGRDAARDARRRDRPGRGPRPLRRPAAPARDRPPALRDRARGRGGGADRRGRRLPAAGAPLVRARRPRDGDLLLGRGASPTTSSANVKADQEHPLLLDRFLEDAIEVDVDALCDGETCVRRRRSCSTSRRPACTRATRPA